MAENDLQKAANSDLTSSKLEAISTRDLNIDYDHFDDFLSNFENEVPQRKADMEFAIKKYIKLIRLHDTNQFVKEKLVSKLCDLRIKLNELNENEVENIHFGHTFNLLNAGKQFSCDVCEKKQKNNRLISLLQTPVKENAFFICVTCNYCVHQDCLKQKTLPTCPKEQFEQSFRQGNINQSYEYVILKICPEIGLSKQEFKCNNCSTQITLSNSYLCDYDGRYYCLKCHNGTLAIIPARVLHNWDFEPRPISKKSSLIVNFIKNKPILFDILKLNSMLYGLVEDLPVIKRIRNELILMVQYTRLCKQPSKPKLRINSYLIEDSNINCYALNDLININQLRLDLISFHSQLLEHITKVCESCKGKGFYCELCQDKTDLLFPFSSKIASCPQCNTVYHKNCYHRKHKRCTRCQRFAEKANKSIKIVNSNESN